MKIRPRHHILPLLILWLAFGLRLYHLDFQSIWWDEGHSIFVASQPILQIPVIPAMDVHPPAYFALLHLWLSIAGTSEFALRYLSVIFSLLTVGLLWRFAASISRQVSPLAPSRSTPLYTALLAALSPLYVAYAQEVRSYAMITFLALVSTYMLWRILFLPTGRGKRWTAIILYIISTAACLYTHYFTIFLLLFQNLAWLWWVWRSRAKSLTSGRVVLWLASQAGILLLFAPQLLLALRQVTNYTNPNLTPPALSQFISSSWQAYTVGLTIDPTPARWGMWLLLIIMLTSWTYGLILTLKHKPQNSKPVISNFLFLITWFLVPLIAYFIILQSQPSFEPRYMILITPALLLLLALGIDQVAGGWLRPKAQPAGWQATGDNVSPFGPTGRFHTAKHPGGALHASPLPALRPLSLAVATVTLYAIPVVIFVIGLHSYYTNPTYFKDDSAGVTDWLVAQTTADDIVYIDVPHPFHYYAEQRGIAAPTRYLFVDIHTAADILTAETAGRDRLFWVTWRGSDTDPRGVIPFLAEKFGQQLGQLDFRGYQVTWYSLPNAGTSFSLPASLSPIQASFGDVLVLDGVAYGGNPPEETTITAGESAWATLHFNLLRDTDVDYRVSLRLRGDDGRIISQVDKDLLNDRHFRTSAWSLADPALNQATNVYTLPIPPDAPPGTYRLEVVVYNAQPPYPSEGVTGHESSDGVAAIVGYITETP